MSSVEDIGQFIVGSSGAEEQSSVGHVDRHDADTREVRNRGLGDVAGCRDGNADLVHVIDGKTDVPDVGAGGHAVQVYHRHASELLGRGVGLVPADSERAADLVDVDDGVHREDVTVVGQAVRVDIHEARDLRHVGRCDAVPVPGDRGGDAELVDVGD